MWNNTTVVYLLVDPGIGSIITKNELKQIFTTVLVASIFWIEEDSKCVY